MTFDGMEATIDKAFGIKIRPDGFRRNNPHKIHLIRYADDFIVTATDKEILENKVKPLIEEFLEQRGLQLSTEKTKITHIANGFDFLGQNIRMYPKRETSYPSNKDGNQIGERKVERYYCKTQGFTSCSFNPKPEPGYYRMG